MWRYLHLVLDNWDAMQTIAGDEGAEVAERFERQFYLFINAFEEWYNELSVKPLQVDEAETHPNIEEIIARLPAPLYVTFYNELIRIVDGEQFCQYD